MFKKMVIFSLIIYSIFFVTVKFYIFPHHYKPTVLLNHSLNIWNRLRDVGEIDFLVVGGAMVMSGVAPAILSRDSYSIAMPAGSLMDTYNLLKKTDLSHVRKGIIISTSFFFERNYENDYWEKMVQVGFYDFGEVIENFRQGKTHQIFPYTQHSQVTYLFNYLKYKSFLNSNVFESFATEDTIALHRENLETMKVRLEKSHGFLSYQEQQKSKKFFYAYRLHFNKPFYSNPTDDYYLKKILELTKNYKVYFVRFPLAEKSHPKINVKSYQSGLENYIEGLSRNYPNLILFKPKSQFLENDFYNFYTLNAAGSFKLSVELKEFLTPTN